MGQNIEQRIKTIELHDQGFSLEQIAERGGGVGHGTIKTWEPCIKTDKRTYSSLARSHTARN